MVNIFFSTDIHGSESTLRKFLNLVSFYRKKHLNIDVLMCCGDLTGKMMIPLVKENGFFTCRLFGSNHTLRTAQQLEKIQKDASDVGFYPYICTREEAEELRYNKVKFEKVFEKLVVERIERWLAEIEDHVPKDVKVIMNSGNDDSFAIDDIIARNKRVISPLDKVIYLDDDYPMISSGWTNPTPWKTVRECSEEELRKKLDVLFDLVDDKTSLVCNFHPPPYSSCLDRAPKLDENLKQVIIGGQQVFEPVGSKAVDSAIREYQPLLLLSGHVHESAGFVKIGRTLCLNPGSEYGEGVLRGHIVNIDKGNINHTRVRG